MKAEKLLIAIDNGKRNMKAKCGDKIICYTNNYSRNLTADEKFLGDNTHNVIYDGVGYTIGQNGRGSDLGEGKATKIQFVQALTAIATLIEPNEKRDIVLMYGESVSMYFDAKHKEFIKENLQKFHEITVDGRKYEFNIQTVQVLPEGLGHIFTNFKKYQGVQYVVDIGGCTINVLKVNNGRPEQESCFSLRLGINNLVSNICLEIKANGLGEQPQDLVYQFLEYRDTCKNDKVLKIIDETIEKQFDTFDSRMIGLGMDLHEILKIQPVIFIGGGSVLLKKIIEKRYGSPDNVSQELVVDDALRSNVKGFYAYGLATFI